MDLGELNKVWELRPLKMPGEDEARRMLDRVAKQVQPIMRKRRWKVQVLSEFCPENPSLLGLNEGGGAQVKLRLRRPDRDWDFLPYEQVLDTMLHELSHIEHGPHNADFYRLWDELRRECEELAAKGITGTGQGFDLPGWRLGGFTRYPPPPPLRQAALAAAERRARAASGPKRLGGDGGIMAALSPIQAAAMAAERRMQDDLWCGSRSSSGSGESLRSSGSNVADSSNSGRVWNSSVVDPTNLSSQSARDSESMNASASVPLFNRCGMDDQRDIGIWECRVCTLFNQPLALICEACGNPKSREHDSKFKIWSCNFCTLENNIKLDKCSACGQWRYSYGPPVSTCGPHLGT